MNLHSTDQPEPSKKDLRLFTLIMTIGLLLLQGWFFEKWWSPFSIFMLAFCAFGLLLPMAYRPLYKGWMVFGAFVGFINIRIIMGLTFFLIFTPLALFFKCIGRDVLNLKKENCKSYWRDYDGHEKSIKRYRKLF